MNYTNLWVLSMAISCSSFTAIAQSNPVVYGRPRNLSVGPNGELWLTTETNNFYFTQGIEQPWKVYKEDNPGIHYRIDSDHPDEIKWMNDDTLIYYGYLSKGFYEYNKNLIYISKNGGETWRSVEFHKRDRWIRDAAAFPGGEIRLASNKGRVISSENMGRTFTKSPKIFTLVWKAYMRGPDIYSFHYFDPERAIAGNKNNQIAITTDNFEHHELIPTPFDQGLYEPKYRSYYLSGGGRKFINNFGITKVRMTQDRYWILQNYQLYSTLKEDIAWKPISPTISDFEIDSTTKRAYVLTNDSLVGFLDEQLSFHLIPDLKIQGKLLDIKVSHGHAYLLVVKYEPPPPADKVRDHTAGFTVYEKNYQEPVQYQIIRTDGANFQLAELPAK